MKSILLASASVVAFAGAAAADVGFSGSAHVGYNDEAVGDHDGFYWGATLSVKLSQELDNGVTASATFNIDVADNDKADDDTNSKNLASGDYLLELSTESSSLQVGDVEFAAVSHWTTAGAQLAEDAFSEIDGESTLRGNISYGDVQASVSYIVADEDGAPVVDDLQQLSIGVNANFGIANVRLAYQDELEVGGNAYSGDITTNEYFGLSVGASFAGADVRLSYANNLTTEEDSTGISVSYPIGPVTVRGVYAVNSAHAEDSYGIRVAYDAAPIKVAVNWESRNDVERWAIDASYDLGNGITVLAGAADRDNWAEEQFYVAGTYDLGNGASLLVSYADGNDADGTVIDDEIGAPEYQKGITAEISFAF